MKKTVISVFCFALVLGLSGCINHQIVPPLEQLETSRLPDITANNPVAVIAVYNPNPEAMVRFCDGGAHRYSAKIDYLTTSAVKNLEAMLKNKNVAVDPKAEKKLSISVIHARCSGVPPYGLSYYVTIMVKTGNGLTHTFTGHNVGGHIFGTDSHVSNAINEAYLVMFYNDEIKAYLKN